MPQQEWQWIPDGLNTAEENMAVDASLLADCAQGLIPPTVRFYGWSEPAITLGYSQKAEAELDMERCRELGIAIVRRPTGGRALLHYNELTYAVVAPVTLAPFDKGLKTTFEAISEALLAGLKNLEIRGGLNTGKHQSGSGYRRSPACFASLNHCEITVDGKKLVGSAQKRTAKAFLQHGSVIIDSDHELFTSLLKFGDEISRTETRQHLLQSTTTLNQLCGREVSLEETAAAIMAGFRTTFGGNWIQGQSSFSPQTSAGIFDEARI